MIRSFAVALLFGALLSLPALAQRIDESSRGAIFRQFHYVLYVDLQNAQLLSYQNSTVSPLERLRVSFQQTTAAAELRHIDSTPLGPIRYEDFWYHGGQALGLERHLHNVPMPKQEQGAICFTADSSAEGFPNTAAAANCTVRLLVEASLANSTIAAVIVPERSADEFLGDLQKFKFFPIERLAPGKQVQTTLRVATYPHSKDRFVYYDRRGI